MADVNSQPTALQIKRRKEDDALQAKVQAKLDKKNAADSQKQGKKSSKKVGQKAPEESAWGLIGNALSKMVARKGDNEDALRVNSKNLEKMAE